MKGGLDSLLLKNVPRTGSANRRGCNSSIKPRASTVMDKQALGDDTIMNNYLPFGGDIDDDAGLTVAEATEVMAPTPVLDPATATRVAREAYEAYCAVNDEDSEDHDPRRSKRARHIESSPLMTDSLNQ